MSRSVIGVRANWPARRSAWHRRKYLARLGRALFKKEADLKPHRIRYWLTPKPDPGFDDEMC